jgi:hypothetical protein
VPGRATLRGGRHPEIAAITLQTPKPSRIAALIRCTQAIGITFRLHAPRVTARAATVRRLSIVYKIESTKTVPPAAAMSSGFDRAVQLDHVDDLESPLGLAGTLLGGDGGAGHGEAAGAGSGGGRCVLPSTSERPCRRSRPVVLAPAARTPGTASRIYLSGADLVVPT